MESKITVGQCPVCGGPTRRAEEEPYEEGEQGEEMELCWNGCYDYRNSYGSHILRVGAKEWRWEDYKGARPKRKRPSEAIDRAVEELKANRQSRYKEPDAQRFLAVLDKDRFDQSTRMVFADWLEEHGYDDEAVFQRKWTRQWQEARDHLLLCAVECRVSLEELLEAATEHLEGKGDEDGTLLLGHLTPEIMFDTKTFWRAYQTVTGRETGGDRGGFFSCAC